MKRLLVSAVAVAALAAGALAAPIYTPPVGVNYVVQYEGDQDGYGDTTGTVGANALDGNWTHKHSSDEWGTEDLGAGQVPCRPGDGGTKIGGVQSLTEGSDTYLRICDALIQGSGAGNNRKLGFYYEDLPGVLDPGYLLLDSGCSLHVRWRLPNALVDGLQGPDGKEIDNDGRGLISLQQNVAASGGAKQIGFSLAVKDVDTGAGTPPATVPNDGLLMNNTNGTTPTAVVDLGETPGTMNVVAMDVTQWHEMWITIIADTSGGGTHRVELYLDGSLTPTTIHLTAGTRAETDGSLINNAAAIGMLHNQSSKKGMMDVDFIKLVEGAYVPLPEPATLALMGLGGLGLLIRRKR